MSNIFLASALALTILCISNTRASEIDVDYLSQSIQQRLSDGDAIAVVAKDMAVADPKLASEILALAFMKAPSAINELFAIAIEIGPESVSELITKAIILSPESAPLITEAAVEAGVDLNVILASAVAGGADVSVISGATASGGESSTFAQIPTVKAPEVLPPPPGLLPSPPFPGPPDPDPFPFPGPGPIEPISSD